MRRIIIFLVFLLLYSNIHAAEIMSVGPDNVQQGTFLAVAITGQNTHFTNGTTFQQGSPSNVWLFSDSKIIYPYKYWVVNDTLIIAQFAIALDANVATYDLAVNNNPYDGLMTFEDAFTIMQYNPQITSITPNATYPGQTLAVSITGRNTNFTQASSTIFQQGTPTITWFTQATPTTTVLWLSQGNAKIYSEAAEAHGKELLMARFKIPSDANSGLWNLHIPVLNDVLTLYNGFRITTPGDLTADGIINFKDLAVVADNWLSGSPGTIYKFSLDTNPGWTVQGQWEFGFPTGQGGMQAGYPDPTSGYTGQNVYGVNLNGDYNSRVSGGPYYLKTPILDCSNFRDVHLKFARWLNTDYPPYVGYSVEISNDGVDWYYLWNPYWSEPMSDSNWQMVDYDISSQADGNSKVYIRWSYVILDGGRAIPYSGWNIDDIELIGKRR